MAYDRPQLYLTWGGTIGGSGDIWQCGVHLAALTTVAVIDQPTAAELQDLYEDTIAPMHSAGDSYISQGAALAWAKIAHLNTAGEYVTDETFYEPASATLGASSVTGSAPQVALAVTLWSGSAFGQANYGRYYLPWSCAPVVLSTGTINSTERDGMAARQKEFLDEINVWGASLDTDVRVSNLSPVGAGTTKQVTTVRIGSVKDTQKRRRNRLVEEYTGLALAP